MQLFSVQVSGVRFQDYESDDVENFKICIFISFLLTPETRHLTPNSNIPISSLTDKKPLPPIVFLTPP